MFKHLGVFLGIILSGLGLFFIIMYLNLLKCGYSFFKIVKLISGTFECYYFIIGILIIIFNIERIKK